ncbi:hypothetical protein [Dysgonomonas reticulitermitis]
MTAITLTDKETAIREKLIKAVSEGEKVYYSDLIGGEDASLIRSLGAILERITRYDIENKQPILASIVVAKSTDLPNEGFFEMCDSVTH